MQFPNRHDSRVVIFDRRLFIILTTDVLNELDRDTLASYDVGKALVSNYSFAYRYNLPQKGIVRWFPRSKCYRKWYLVIPINLRLLFEWAYIGEE